MSKRGSMFPTALWSERGFEKLSRDEQHLLLRVWLSPDLSSCGHHAIQLGLWGRGFTPQATAEQMRDVVAALEGHGWIATDFDTEELLIVPFIRLDASKQPQIFTSACRTIQTVRSAILRERAWEQVQRVGVPGVKESPRVGPDKLDRMQRSVHAAYNELMVFMLDTEVEKRLG
jgi:hypothetical protein